ncbi:hypothetical protein FB465_2564 [Kitasatospora atroaurantiaca]|uniref:Uncharacterized protein n=1 Tax=Kitasatospora atroaurantiaca TaxID=285545 RepID=A0A561EPI7_9ACTN|nr:hypothetical protein FB465_2564 [Kitasatospora atroaurantiaca]
MALAAGPLARLSTTTSEARTTLGERTATRSTLAGFTNYATRAADEARTRAATSTALATTSSSTASGALHSTGTKGVGAFRSSSTAGTTGTEPAAPSCTRASGGTALSATSGKTAAAYTECPSTGVASTGSPRAAAGSA